MREPTIGRLAVPGAELHYEVRGAGPPLLIIPTGNGDATPFEPLANLIADRYTVITYDRRGFSRSPLLSRVETHRRLADDVADARRLLERLAGTHAYVFGSSSGAIIALALLEHHPRHVRALVCHEPPLASVLPDATRWLDFYADLYIVYRDRGPDEARRMFRSRMGMQESTRPPKAFEQPPARLAEMLDRLRRNQVFWFEHEIRTYPAYRPDLAKLAEVADRLILAGGNTSREHFPYRPNVALAERLGLPMWHLPGGHVGYVTHPVEFAAALTGRLPSP
ncbi:alpha/beta hydrolase [Allorhizocola rhizosphaerae]|uniref:alpha/beta hydrolase n=1 Tax=Allorhizocola rhizosphaerae TaxID=1872709 RepID=UPI000E3B5695|nr:alpha/beta fold hydrolase [Allorhizocola rhizosphaerae]